MAVDVFTHEQLLIAERQLLLPEADKLLGRFTMGDVVSVKIGTGFEVDGFRDYQPGDDARLVDWRKSASRTDDGLWVRELLEESSPLTVLVSDMPSDRYARSRDPITPRAVGMITANAILRVATTQEHSAVLPVWSVGETTRFDLTSASPKAQMGKHAARRSIEAGLELARFSTGLATSRRQSIEQDRILAMLSQRKQRKFLQETPRIEAPNQEERPFSAVVALAKAKASRYNEISRYVFISDFVRDTDASVEQIRTTPKGTDTTAIQVIHSGLLELPPVGEAVSLSNGTNLLIESEDQRDSYRSGALERQKQIYEKLRNAGARVIVLNTANPEWVRALINGFKA